MAELKEHLNNINRYYGRVEIFDKLNQAEKIYHRDNPNLPNYIDVKTTPAEIFLGQLNKQIGPRKIERDPKGNLKIHD